MSKDEVSASQIVTPLTNEQKAASLIQFQQDWDNVKNDIIEGKLDRESLKEKAAVLYDHRMQTGVLSTPVISNMTKELEDAKISKENLHQFVSVILEVELEVEKKQSNSPGIMRESGRTLAATFFNLENKINGFGQDIIAAVNTGDEKKILEAYANVEIPGYMKDHYKPIFEAYKDSPKLEKETYTNIVFNGLKTSVRNALENDAKNNPDPRAQQEVSPKIKLCDKMSAVVYPGQSASIKYGYQNISGFDSNKIYDGLKAQMNNEKPDPQIKENLLKSAFERYKVSKQKDKEMEQERVSPQSVPVKDKNFQLNKNSSKTKGGQSMKNDKKEEQQKKVSSKTFEQRFSEFKKKVSNSVKPKEQKKQEEKSRELKKPFTAASYVDSLINDKEFLNKMEQKSNLNAAIVKEPVPPPIVPIVNKTQGLDHTVSNNSTKLSNETKMEVDKLVEAMEALKAGKLDSLVESTKRDAAGKEGVDKKVDLSRKNTNNSKESEPSKNSPQTANTWKSAKPRTFKPRGSGGPAL